MDFALQGDTLALLFFVALAAGFIDAMAGGGGLITIPALLLVQLPPISGAWHQQITGLLRQSYRRRHHAEKRSSPLPDVRGPFLTAFVGAGLGTLAVQQIDPKALDAIIPLILVGIGLYFLLAPSAGDIERKPRLPDRPYRLLVVPVIGFYDGFFGPGTGSFFSLVGVSLPRPDPDHRHRLRQDPEFRHQCRLAPDVHSGREGDLGGRPGDGVRASDRRLCRHARRIKGGARLIRPVIVLVCFGMVCRYFWQKGMLPF